MTTEPSKGYERLSRTRTRRRYDMGPVRHVPSIAIGPVRPSPPLRHHLEHCSTIPGVVGSQDDKTSPRLLSCDLQPSVSPTLELTHTQRPKEKLPRRYPRSRPWTSTGLAVTLCRKQDSPGRPSTLWHCTPYGHT
jgi:hypothetical protein